MNVSIPLHRSRCEAATREAHFRFGKFQAKNLQQFDITSFDLESVAEFDGSRQMVARYVARILPVTLASVETAATRSRQWE